MRNSNLKTSKFSAQLLSCPGFQNDGDDADTPVDTDTDSDDNGRSAPRGLFWLTCVGAFIG